MPCQAANREPQNTPFVIHARLGQPMTKCLLPLAHGIFQLRGGAACGGTALAPHRAGRMQVENRQTWVGAFRLTGREEATAVGERQQVADLGLRPATFGDTCSQHLIEQVAAPGRKQPRTHVTLLGQRLAGGPVEGIMDVAPAVAETLGAEIVGHTVLLELCQAGIHSLVVSSKGCQAQGEAVGRMRATL